MEASAWASYFERLSPTSVVGSGPLAAPGDEGPGPVQRARHTNDDEEQPDRDDRNPCRSPSLPAGAEVESHRSRLLPACTSSKQARSPLLPQPVRSFLRGSPFLPQSSRSCRVRCPFLPPRRRSVTDDGVLFFLCPGPASQVTMSFSSDVWVQRHG